MKALRRLPTTAFSLSWCIALSSCSLLFEPSEVESEDVVLSRELVSTIGANQDFATLAEWMALRGGNLPERQAMRVRNVGTAPGTQHILTGRNCEGIVRPVRASSATTQLLILDLAAGSSECTEGEVLRGSGGVELEVIEVQPKGVSERLEFITSPVLGPLTTDSEDLSTSEEFSLTLAAGASHNGLAGAGIEVVNPAGVTDHGIAIATDFTRVEGFEIHSWIREETNLDFSALRITGNYVTADRLLIHDETGSNIVKSDGITAGPNAYGTVITNSILYDLGRAGIHAEWNGPEQSPAPMRVANCTLRRCTMYVDGGSRYGCVGRENFLITVVNTVALIEGGAGEAFVDTFSIDSHHNAADDGTAPGLPAYSAATENFSDTSDLHLSDDVSPLRGCGLTLSTTEASPIMLDIDGEERPSTGWSIGADQVLDATCQDDG